MRNAILAIGIVALVCAVGCSREGPPPTAAVKKLPASAVKKLPVVVLKYDTYPDKTEYLEGRYGFLIKWNESEPPMFYVYDATRWHIDTAGDFAEFLRLLSALPDDIQIRWMTSCGGGFYWAMPDENREEIAKLKTAKRWSYPENEDVLYSVVCICESKSIVFLEKAP